MTAELAETAPVFRLEADGKTWPIDGSPVPGPTALGYVPVRVDRPSPDVLEVVPTRAGRLIGVVLLAIAVGIALFGVSLLTLVDFGPGPRRGDWVGLCMGVVVGVFMTVVGTVYGLYCLTVRLRFDRPAGEMTERWAFGTRRSLPLDDLLAVQCLHAARVEGGRGGPYDLYQINLVWRVPRLLRAGVWHDVDPARVRAVAAELAHFLGVPLVDQIDETRAYQMRDYGSWRWFWRRVRGK